MVCGEISLIEFSCRNKENDGREVMLNAGVINRRLLHQIILVDGASMLKIITNIPGRRPPDSARVLKIDEINKRNDDEFDRVGNKRRRLIRFPIIPKKHIA
jgi:hypothetical protein